VTKRGFTFIEILSILAIICILIAVSYPSLINIQEERQLENTARDVLTTLQQAKFYAVKTKLNHRVIFLNEKGVWIFFIEKEDNRDEWNQISGFMRKSIPLRFNVYINLPNQTVVFSPLGLIPNFTTGQNNVTLQSPKLRRYNKADQRSINVFAGGSVRYLKSWSEK